MKFAESNKTSGSDLGNILYKRRIDTLESVAYELMDQFKSLELENEKLKRIVLR